jgi:hypothetical protein
MHKEGWVLTDNIELSSEQATVLLVFLTSEENALKQIASDEDRNAREVLGTVFWFIG